MVLHEDPHCTFRVADDRVIPRFHLDCAPAGTPVGVHRIDAVTERRHELLTTAVTGEGGWVGLVEPIRLRAGDAFVAMPGPCSDAAGPA
jgi:hypothetical protein